MITFLIFRAESAPSIYNLLMSVIGLGQPVNPWAFSLNSSQIFALIAAIIVALGLPEPYQISERQFWRTPFFAFGTAAVLVVIIIYLGGSFEQEFIYFQF